jgi:hypothetical protein
VPSSIGSGAVYGIGIYGTSQYGVASVTVFVDGVSSNFVLNDTLQIQADALHVIDTPNTDPLDSFVGNVSVSAEAIVVPTGVEATGSLGTVIQKSSNIVPVVSVFGAAEVGTVALETNNYIDVTGFVATGFVGSVNVVAKATVAVTGVFGTTAVGTVVILENEVITSPTSIAVLTAGNLTITTTSFNFNAVASQYSRSRTAYIPRRSTAKERTVIIPAGQ